MVSRVAFVTGLAIFLAFAGGCGDDPARAEIERYDEVAFRPAWRTLEYLNQLRHFSPITPTGLESKKAGSLLAVIQSYDEAAQRLFQYEPQSASLKTLHEPVAAFHKGVSASVQKLREAIKSNRADALRSAYTELDGLAYSSTRDAFEVGAKSHSAHLVRPEPRAGGLDI